jgi:hypothetical protein
MKIILSFTETKEEIIEEEMSIDEIIKKIGYSNDKVYVWFYTSKSAKRENRFTDEHPQFLITCFLPEIRHVLNDVQFVLDVEQNVFGFENYYEAFKYCMDLKDGTE